MITQTIMPELVIDSKQTTSGIQKVFNDYYPFLKIEFFRQASHSGRNEKSKMIVTDLKLSDIQNKKKRGRIELGTSMKVSDLENVFEKEYGLHIQIFRKSGKIWLETTATDNWTLQQQNEEGKSLYEHLKEEPESPDDHDIY